MRPFLMIAHGAQAAIDLGPARLVLAVLRDCATSEAPDDEAPSGRDRSLSQICEPEDDDDLLPRASRAGPGVLIDD